MVVNNIDKALISKSIICSFLLFTACKKENGCFIESGKTITKELILPEFNSIESWLKADYTLHSGSEQKVTVTGDKNIVMLLEKESQVIDDTWLLKFNSCVADYSPLRIDITRPTYLSINQAGVGNTISLNSLNNSGDFSLSLTGSGTMNISVANTDSVNVLLSGTGDVELSGQADYISIANKGTGKVSAFNLIANTADVSIAGDGIVTTNATSFLNCLINGNGIIYFKGYPTITTMINGNGSVVDAN